MSLKLVVCLIASSAALITSSCAKSDAVPRMVKAEVFEKRFQRVDMPETMFVTKFMGIKDGVVPPTINNVTPDPELDPKLNFTFNKAQHREVRAALSNTFGFGGHNTSAIFKKY